MKTFRKTRRRTGRLGSTCLTRDLPQDTEERHLRFERGQDEPDVRDHLLRRLGVLDEHKPLIIAPAVLVASVIDIIVGYRREYPSDVE